MKNEPQPWLRLRMRSFIHALLILMVALAIVLICQRRNKVYNVFDVNNVRLPDIDWDAVRKASASNDHLAKCMVHSQVNAANMYKMSQDDSNDVYTVICQNNGTNIAIDSIVVDDRDTVCLMRTLVRIKVSVHGTELKYAIYLCRCKPDRWLYLGKKSAWY